MLVGGLIGYGAYKMSQRDADRIEQHTGVPPEELDDQELGQAMDELGIEKQYVTDADQEAGGGQPGQPAQAAPSAADSDLDELQKLADLHAQGVLSDEEFAAAKAKILGDL